MSFINGRTIPNPETEEVVLTANFYNNPLGKVDDAVKSEIDHMKDSWLVKGDWIDWITTLLEISQLICESIKKLSEIQGLVAAVSDGLGGCCSTNNPYTEAFCCPASSATGVSEEAVGYTKEGTYASFNKFCYFALSNY